MKTKKTIKNTHIKTKICNQGLTLLKLAEQKRALSMIKVDKVLFLWFKHQNIYSNSSPFQRWKKMLRDLDAFKSFKERIMLFDKQTMFNCQFF